MSVYGVALLPVIIGLVQLARIFGMSSRLSPVLSIVVGIVLSLIYVAPGDFKKSFLVGLWLGLCATGLHSGFKNTMNGTFKKKDSNKGCDEEDT
ncbi:hypothetical protein FCL54_05380 [Pseudalkalibacillus caeni]|uniref:Holin n=1 Tax=Exobacillus caeni TaxID=2574798 RepID=A0A5R9F6E3_9BACL|nr:hypothetical protein FCL54_05380 [Pseudalkalibacillus caeni]